MGKKREKSIRWINGKKFIENTPYVYSNKENCRYESLEARRDNKFGMGDPFLFRTVKLKKGWVTFIYDLGKSKKKK